MIAYLCIRLHMRGRGRESESQFAVYHCTNEEGHWTHIALYAKDVFPVPGNPAISVMPPRGTP